MSLDRSKAPDYVCFVIHNGRRTRLQWVDSIGLALRPCDPLPVLYRGRERLGDVFSDAFSAMPRNGFAFERLDLCFFLFDLVQHSSHFVDALLPGPLFFLFGVTPCAGREGDFHHSSDRGRQLLLELRTIVIPPGPSQSFWAVIPEFERQRSSRFELDAIVSIGARPCRGLDLT